MDPQRPLTVGILLGILCTSGCAGQGQDSSSASSTTVDSLGVIRPVSVDEFPAVFAACLEDLGFPPSGTAPDGSRE